jgi:hypothetical protein
LAVNLSDAFTFQEKERQGSEADVFDKDRQDGEHEGLEMKRVEPSKPKVHEANDGRATEPAQDDGSGIANKEPLPPVVATSASLAEPEEPPRTALTSNDA